MNTAPRLSCRVLSVNARFGPFAFLQGGCFPSSILRNAAGHIHRNNGHCVKPSGQVTTYTVENQSTAQTVGYKTESSKQYSLSIPGSQDNGHSIRAQPQEMETTSDFTSTSRFLHPVLEVLERRRTAQCTPCSRTDGYKLGLVVEGGGMRGAISGSMLM